MTIFERDLTKLQLKKTKPEGKLTYPVANTPFVAK